jgi:choline dehydrogenase
LDEGARDRGISASGFAGQIDPPMKAFDYIVVGSGSAGAIIAARLSEDADASVLLLEAGGRDSHPFMAMPIAFPKVAANPAFVWNFETEAEPGLNGRKLPIWRGRTLGGCSSINAMINSRGNPHDYDLMEQRGLHGWGFRDVLPYFKRLETSWRGASGLHGAEGPISNVPVDIPDALFPEIRQAATHFGLPVCDDQNGLDQSGVSRIELTVNRGRRASTASAYLRPAMRRRNLTVLTRAQATRVLIERHRAVGVEYTRNGKLERVYAGCEVIVSSGTYKSPHLLMLSGIGPADHLRSMGIEAVHDVKGVGENLQEHPNLLNIYRLKDAVGMTRHLRFDRATWAVARWALLRDGPFTTAGTTANIFMRSQPGLAQPDIQTIVMPVHQHAELWFPGLTRSPVYAFTARVGILHARSRGWVRLRSADPADHPRIQFNMFTEQADMDVMTRAVRLSRELFRQDPLRDMVADELQPGATVQSDDELAEAIRDNAEHRHHAVGTCRMGIGDEAVVDLELRVRGIDNLRVADASIFPDDTSGNTNVPTMMVGEKAADLIRGRRLAPEGPATAAAVLVAG